MGVFQWAEHAKMPLLHRKCQEEAQASLWPKASINPFSPKEKCAVEKEVFQPLFATMWSGPVTQLVCYDNYGQEAAMGQKTK